MKKILSLLKTKYRIKTITVGVRERYQIQKSAFGFMWDTVINPLVSNQSTPYEYKLASDARKKINELEKIASV